MKKNNKIIMLVCLALTIIPFSVVRKASATLYAVKFEVLSVYVDDHEDSPYDPNSIGEFYARSFYKRDEVDSSVTWGMERKLAVDSTSETDHEHWNGAELDSNDKIFFQVIEKDTGFDDGIIPGINMNDNDWWYWMWAPVTSGFGEYEYTFWTSGSSGCNMEIMITVTQFY
jgi:hypothetical protein